MRSLVRLTAGTERAYAHTQQWREVIGMLRWFLFETKLGDLTLRLFERVTGFGLVELEEMEAWEFGIEKPTQV
jgi:hypothetical protein